MNNKLITFFFIVIVFSFIALGYLFISEDMKYNKWVVETTRCGTEKVDTVTFITRGEKNNIDTYREAVPVLRIGQKKIVNICDYKILSKTEK